MIWTIILVVFALDLILRLVLFLMSIYKCKLDKDIDKLVNDLRKDAGDRRYNKGKDR